MESIVAKRSLCSGCRRLLGRKALQPVLGQGFQYSTNSVSRGNGKPFRMAVIGSGPAGFYTAYRVMSKIQGAKVDMYEQLPVPFGLVRFGVAPDHPEVKNCQDKFEEVASSPDFTFIGNTSVGQPSTHTDGKTVQLSSVLRHYDAVVFSYGAAKDRTLGIPGESTLRGIYSAREFVGWYNGLPEYRGLAPDLTRGDEAVIIGQGNVALDVARMLLEDIDVLRKTDITEYAIAELARSRVKRVHIVGRRGPMQAAFTIKEIRELMKLPRVAMSPFDKGLIPSELKSLPRPLKRLMEVVLKGSATSLQEAEKAFSLDFCLSPKAFSARGDDPSSVGATAFQKTLLSDPFDPMSTTLATEETAEFSSPLVFRSIGYKSVAFPEFSDAGILFDDRRGIIQNDGLGRVLREVRTVDGAVSQEHNPGLYCAGWVKRGPTGVIASTMEDAFTTGDAIAHDWSTGGSFLRPDSPVEGLGWEGVLSEGPASVGRVVRWKDWQKIDQAEKVRGQARGKEREKFGTTDEMLEVLQ